MNRLRREIHEFFYTLLAFPRAWRFMVNHRLWEGLRQYGWVARALVVVGIMAAIHMVSEIGDWFNQHQNDSLSAMVIGGDSLFIRWFKDLSESMSDGMLNWIILVLLEVVIYHFMRRTLQIILRKNVENAHKFKPFLDAQIRMIVVSMGAVAVEGLILNTAENIYDGWLFWPLSILVRSIFLGYVIADNYNEQFGLKIEQSWRNLYRSYIGICAGLGLPLLIMMQVPIIGSVLGPLVTSVTAAIVLREKSDLHIIGYQMSEKEREAAEKKAAKKARKAAKKAARKGRLVS